MSVIPPDEFSERDGPHHTNLDRDYFEYTISTAYCCEICKRSYLVDHPHPHAPNVPNFTICSYCQNGEEKEFAALCCNNGWLGVFVPHKVIPPHVLVCKRCGSLVDHATLVENLKEDYSALYNDRYGPNSSFKPPVDTPTPDTRPSTNQRRLEIEEEGN